VIRGGSWDSDGSSCRSAYRHDAYAPDDPFSHIGFRAVLDTGGLGPLVIALYPGVTIEGVVGKTFAVQYTTDLDEPRTWTTLATITLASPKQLWYDTEPAAQPKRFYRVIAAP
jgi:hypothetical protein